MDVRAGSFCGAAAVRYVARVVEAQLPWLGGLRSLRA